MLFLIAVERTAIKKTKALLAKLKTDLQIAWFRINMNRMLALKFTLSLQKCLSKTSFVIPAKAGIQGYPKRLDSRFRGNDRNSQKV